MASEFNYSEAFSRNLGWVTKEEQERLRQSKIAIGGVGGVGGIHLITLVRLGLTRFHLADPDVFELKNFNRQYGADLTTLGRPKCDVMVAKAMDINPEIQSKIFPCGLTPDNVEEFLDGVDVFIDGLDIYAVDIREFVFAACRKKGIPCVTVAPLGMGAAVTCFTPDSISFEDYFGVSGKKSLEKTLRFVLGMGVSLIHLKSLVAREYSDLRNNRASSTPMGCALAAGVMGAEVLKLILARGPIAKAPKLIHYDSYSYTLKKSYLWLGHRNPFFLIKLKIMQIILNKIKLKTR